MKSSGLAVISTCPSWTLRSRKGLLDEVGIESMIRTANAGGLRSSTFPARPLGPSPRGGDGFSRFSPIECPHALEVFDRAGSRVHSPWRAPACGLPRCTTASSPWLRLVSRLDIPPVGAPVNVSPALLRVRHMTRCHGGWLDPRCETLSFSARCRFIPPLSVHPAKPKIGLRTTRANEMWHIDTTVIRLLDGTRAYLHAVIESFSRRTLAWRVRPRSRSHNRQICGASRRCRQSVAGVVRRATKSAAHGDWRRCVTKPAATRAAAPRR
jgi:hypothetical protein